MSKYSTEYLRTNVLVGDVDIHGLPWHSSGMDVDKAKNLFRGPVPVDQARKLFKRYAVESRTLGTLNKAGEFVPDETRQAIVDKRSGLVHFTPRPGYVIHPFEDVLLNDLAEIVGDTPGDLHIDSVGVLANGGEGWLSISTGDLLTTPEGVDFKPHILAATSHNGTLSTTYKPVATMTVCDNTRDMALGERGARFKVRHTRLSANRLADARDALGLIEQEVEVFNTAVAELCAWTITDAQFDAFVDELAPLSDDMSKHLATRTTKYRDRIHDMYREDDRVQQWNGTAFGALQAVNTFDLWERGTRGGTQASDRMIRETITGTRAETEDKHLNALRKVCA